MDVLKECQLDEKGSRDMFAMMLYERIEKLEQQVDDLPADTASKTLELRENMSSLRDIISQIKCKDIGWKLATEERITRLAHEVWTLQNKHMVNENRLINYGQFALSAFGFAYVLLSKSLLRDFVQGKYRRAGLI